MSRFLSIFPRALSILFLCFLMLFSFDVLSMDGTVIEKIGGFFMHNIPVIILSVVLWISWKHELVGAIAFLLAGILYIGMTVQNVPLGMALSWSAIIAGPALLISLCFFLSYMNKSKRVTRP